MTNTLARRNDRPTLEEVLEDIGPLPSEALFIGMAEDYLPMMVNVRDNNTPNILIWNGETSFLKMVAEFIMNRDIREHQEIEFVVFTNNTEEWKFLAKETNFKKNSPCIGVIPFWDSLADQVLLGLASWIHQGVKPNHSVVVLIEGVENVINMDLDAKQNFNYIFLKGKDRRVFAIGTAPMGIDLRGLQDVFTYQGEYKNTSDRYEFPEGNRKIKVWLPKENRK